MEGTGCQNEKTLSTLVSNRVDNEFINEINHCSLTHVKLVFIHAYL